MRRSCLDCEYFDKEHYDMYEEAICTKADETIRLRRGQHHPRWCPVVIEQRANKEYEAQLNFDYSAHYGGTL